MKIEDYQIACGRTKNDLGPMLNAAHMALGFASELSELYECICQEGDVNIVNLGEELGDKCWYIGNYATDRQFKLTSELYSTPLDYTPYDTLIINGGKLADYAKRWLAYGQSINDNKKLNEEGKVIAQYISAIHAIAIINGLDIETIMAKNIAKLYTRYPDKFTNDQAIIRNIEEELKVLS